MNSGDLYKISYVLALTVASVASFAHFAHFTHGADKGTVVIASYGGAFERGEARAIFQPYANASGIKVIGTTGTSYPKVKAMEASGEITWDVINAESPAWVNEWKDGLLMPIDYSIVKADGVPAESRRKYGVGAIKFSQTLAWSREKFPRGLTPAQFFDPRVKARRVLPSDPTYSLEFALMADGVKPAALYPLDVDRAFRVIDRIKDQVVGYKGPSDIAALVQQGEVDMAYVANGRIVEAISAGANWTYSWDASLTDTEFWAVMKGAPHPREAMKFINFAIQPRQQAAFTRQINYGPTNLQALKLLPPALARTLPSDPANAARGGVLNSEWWNRNYDTVKARWSAYIMH